MSDANGDTRTRGLPVLSLCSGIGGLDLGIKIAVPDARVDAYVEKDAYCRRVLRARMEDGWLDRAPVFEDLLDFDGNAWRGRIGLIAAGFPCQDISNAGRRDGIREGNRSGLWFEVARVIGEVRPRYVFLENVAALLGRGMGTVLGDLSRLGYDACWCVVSAADAGAPHWRKRVFILAYPAGVRCEQLRPISRSQSTGDGEGWLPESTGGSIALVDARRAERGQDALARGYRCEGEDGEGQATGGAGERSIPVVDAERQCGERWRAAGDVASACRCAEGEARERQRGGDTADDSSDRGLPVFPPGREDRDAWREILGRYPDLAPAQPTVRGVAHGTAHRVDRLRALGNGAVPLAAAYALRTLAARRDE